MNTDSLPEFIADTEMLVSMISNILNDHRTTRSVEPFFDQIRNELPEAYVWPARTDLCRGGPEEGGWYFHASAPLDRVQKREPMKLRIDLALRYVQRANALCDVLINRHRRPLHSVASNGVIGFEWSLEPPHTKPRERPHYC
jgi:hypothetical protein